MTAKNQPYNQLRFTLSIVYCTSREKLVDIKVDKIYHTRNGHLVEYSEEERNTLVVFNENSIEFCGLENTRKRYAFPTNRVTMKRFVEAIIDFEKIDRLTREWFGEIDRHHIFYEGLYANEDGSYGIFWGS